AAAVSRPAESALESQGAYDQAIAEGKSEEEADKIADDVFKNNLALAGLDAGEFLSAFSPIKFR
ncbi:MAG: hypothetical protein GWN31_14560, partial [Candidatus Thorarchaeota archaeon]|nr:hypothetical protein [Nitrosopumilaceae archaeon]NIV66655.1 hypothetical protein [Nitrosopumilaceae archaeon]NIW15116.1 hypothetical protein [Candidatus Thorarchaeota archaeon]NIX63189.1 hypothetical protein [Nitrosopumilaceae archaeon]